MITTAASAGTGGRFLCIATSAYCMALFALSLKRWRLPLYRYLRYVPKNHLSRTIGRLVRARLPQPVARRLVRWFANTYQIDVDAANRPLHEYPSIGHFFIRDL